MNRVVSRPETVKKNNRDYIFPDEHVIKEISMGRFVSEEETRTGLQEGIQP